MSHINWEQLESPNVMTAWTMVRRQISEEFFDGKMICVPSLDEAANYQPMMCFAKPNPGGRGKVFSLTGDYYHLIGHLNDLIKTSGVVSTNMKKFEFASEHSIKGEVNQKNLSRRWENDGQSIEINMRGISKEVINWENLREGDIVFQTSEFDLEQRRSLYIITEVVFAKTVLVVTVDGRNLKKQEINEKIPVAFRYAKFPLFKDGVLHPATEQKVHINAVFAPMGHSPQTPHVHEMSHIKLESVYNPFLIHHLKREPSPSSDSE